MNLESLNLVELNAQEVQEVEGGLWPVVALVVIYLAGEIYKSSTGQGEYGHP